MLRNLIALLALPLLACGGSKDDTQAADQAADMAASIAAAIDAGPPPPPQKLPVERFLPEGGDEKAALAKIDAVPAFDAVQYRPRYLARNGQSGVVFGRLGAETDGRYRWLVDETDGQGSLGVRIVVADDLDATLGDRLVVWGAWKVDEERHWYWEPTKLAGLSSTDEPMSEATPFHIATLDEAPEGAVPVSNLKRRGDIIFEVISEPRLIDDGWLVGDRSSWGRVAVVRMPGERPVYGAQFLYGEEEQWKLEKDVRYTVSVGPFTKPKKKGVPTMTALGPPRIIKVSDDGDSKKKAEKKKDTKKAAPKKAAPKKDTKKTEPKKAEPKKTEPKKTEPKKTGDEPKDT